MRKLKFYLLMIFLFAVGTHYATAQDKRVVTGTVTDSIGKPLVGVSVSIKGGKVLTATNENGQFTVHLLPSQKTLVFNSVGYFNVEKNIGDQSSVSITLINNTANSGDEVVVTAMGIKREKKALGYSAVSINTDKLKDIGSPINAVSALYGQAAGLKITSTAIGPGGGMNVRIRSAVAMNQNSNTQPLFVIDGVPMLNGVSNSSGFVNGGNVDINRSTGTGLNDLNIDDIASFEILKGAKASVLYGAAGGNGVILITTKTGGKKKGIGVDASFTRSFDRPWIMQKFQNEYGSGFPVPWEVYTYGSQQDAQGFYLKNGVQAYSPTTYNFGPKMDGRQLLWYDSVMRPYVAQPNNVKEFYQNGYTQKANVSAQGGGEWGGARFSYTRSDYKGIFLGYKEQENNFNFNVNVKATNRLNIKLVSTFTNSFTHNPPATNQNIFVTYGVARDLDTKLLQTQIVDPTTGYLWFNMDNRINRFSPGGTTRTSLAHDYFWNQTQNAYNTTRNHFINSLTLSFNLARGLSLDVMGGFDWINTSTETKEKVEQPLSLNPTSGYGNYSISNAKDIGYNGQAILNYNKQINKDFALYANIGGVINSTSNQFMQIGTNGGFNIRDFFSLANSKKPITSSATRGSDLLYGALATVQLSYKEMLFIEASGRNDWASILPSNQNSYFYPGISASWLFSQVLKMPTWFNYGKLRASYANLGLPGPRYFSNNIYSVGSYPGYGATFSPPNSLPPANLVPEKRKELELGIETKFLDNRLGLEVNYYHSNRYKAIIGLSLPASTGVGSIGINAGDIAQNGFEIQLTGTPIRTKDFQWNINLNGANDRPKVKKLFPGITQQTLWGATGATIAAIEGHPWGEILLNPYITDSKTGKRVVDGNGYYDTDPSKQVPMGNVLPNLTGGFNNTFTYKGFSLNCNIDFQFGSKLISQTNMYMIGNGSSINTLQGRDAAHGGLSYYVASNGAFVQTSGTSGPAGSKYGGTVFHDGVILDGVKADGTPNTTIITAADKYSYYWRSFMDLQPDVIYKNDYIKIRNVVLAYEFPKSMATKLMVQRLSLAFFINNLAYIHKTMPNVDAEAINGTNNFTENNGFPATRSYGFTLRTTF